jgi:hypothetical protein
LLSYLVWHRAIIKSFWKQIHYLPSFQQLILNNQSPHVTMICLTFEAILPLEGDITWYNFLSQKLTYFDHFTRWRICITLYVGQANPRSYRSASNITFFLHLCFFSVWTHKPNRISCKNYKAIFILDTLLIISKYG